MHFIIEGRSKCTDFILFIRSLSPEWIIMTMHCNISHAFHNLEVPKLLWQEYHYFTLTSSLKLLLARIPLFRFDNSLKLQLGQPVIVCFLWSWIHSDFESHHCRWTCKPNAYHDWFCWSLLNNIKQNTINVKCIKRNKYKI